MRKLFLTAFVLFIDTSSGSSKILRLIVGCVVFGTYLALLTFARPYKRFDDLPLAAFSNLLLTIIFALTIIIKVCNEDGSCLALIGLAGSDGAALLVVLLTVLILLVSIVTIAFQAATAVSAPSITLVSTRRAPVLDLPVDCQFHCFLSHVWGSGQDTTHTIARKMQLLLPSVRIWLDVDHLKTISKLDEEVARAAILVIFANKNYFKSKNCRTELYAALHHKKPIVVILDQKKNGSSLEDLRRECHDYCVDVAPPEYPTFSGPSEAIAAMFEHEEPVLWSRMHDFQQASLKIIVTRILQHLPYYTARKAELEAGIMVTNQIGPHSFRRPVLILTCSSNGGAQRIASEHAGAACHPGAACVEVAEVLSEDSLAEITTNAAISRVLLVYLNKQTFAGEDGTQTAGALRYILDADIPFVLVHKTDPFVDGCPFSTLVKAAPKDLLVAPYKLFGQIAVALFPTQEFRSVSLRLLLRQMGAAPLRSKWCARLVPSLRLSSLAFARCAGFGATKMPPPQVQLAQRAHV
jgi:hypothetical protein